MFKDLPLWMGKRWQDISSRDRDARYVLLLIIYIPVLLITTIQAFNKGWFDSFERPLFHAVNNLPHFFYYPMLILTQFGSLGSIFFWVAAAWILVNRRCAGIVAGSGALGWLGAKVLKNWVHRGRPQDLLHSVTQLHGGHFTGFGFPSGHATFSAACATALYYQAAPKYRKYLLWLVFLVGLSRMYLGAHFPLDVVGGWALGITMASGLSLLLGNSRSAVRASYIKKILRKRDYELETVRFLQLDARGSRPLYIKDKQGQEYFAKLFGSQEHAADWLFKLYRLFRYKNLQAEEPYFNGRRNVEVEALANLWAHKSGVRVPEVIDFVKAGRYWLLIQQKIDATQLCDLPKINSKSLTDAWRQVEKLHEIPMAHRDLRAANLMIDKKGQAWLIDFGFAETSPNRRRIYMDNAELLMSMTLVVGTKRTLEAAGSALTKAELKATLPYLQKSIFSGATRQALRKDRKLLPELIEAIKDEVNYKGEVGQPNIDRFNLKSLINMLLLAAFLYIILPQFKQFKAAFVSVDNIRYFWLLIVAAFSLLTYVAAGAIYVVLADIPLKLREATLIQLAASFMTKILPGGIGGTSLTARYLTKSGLETAEAATLIVAQSLIGFVMFSVPLLLFLVFSGHSLGHQFSSHVHVHGKLILAIIAVLLAAVLAVIFVNKLRVKVLSLAAKTIAQARDLTTSPWQLVSAAAVSLLITIFYIACLYAAAHAIHVNLSIIDAILAYAIAVIAKSVIPTPGGLGPLEVAMAASLINTGIGQGQAIATVIVYRLATFWLPIPFSLLAYKYAQKKSLI